MNTSHIHEYFPAAPLEEGRGKNYPEKRQANDSAPNLLASLVIVCYVDISWR